MTWEFIRPSPNLFGQQTFGWPDCNAVPHFPESVQGQDFLRGPSSMCVVTLWETSTVPLKSLIPGQELIDSEQARAHVHGRQIILKETVEHLLPGDPEDSWFHPENIHPRADFSIGCPCLCQNDSITSIITLSTIKLLLEIMHLVNPVIKLNWRLSASGTGSVDSVDSFECRHSGILICTPRELGVGAWPSRA